MMRIVHTTCDIGPTSFGIGPVVLQILRTQIQLGHQASLWCLSTEEDVAWASTTNDLDADAIIRFRSQGPDRLAWSPAMERAAMDPDRSRVDIVHQHSLWTAISRVTSKLRRQQNVPTVIAPHGTLQSWALRRSRLKKRIACIGYETENLRSASCFHAVADTEIADIRMYGLSAPVAVIPNAVSESWIQSTGDANRFREAFGIPSDRRILIFLSRVTPKKGIPMLLKAIHACGKRFDDWMLTIAGADEFGHQAEVETLISELGLVHSVKLVGPLLNQIKRDAFAAAEIFVLPSYSEGAPMVIPEALGVGVPVLATKASPWPALSTHSCGWWTEISQQGIQEALLDAIESSPDRLKEMGAKGRVLISDEYTWPRIAPRTLLVYDWLLHRGPRPDFVVVD